MVSHLLCTQGLIEMLRTSALVGSTLILLEADKRSVSTLTAAPHKSLGRSNHFLADSVNNKQQHFSAKSHQSHLWSSQATGASEQFSLSPLLCVPWWWGYREKEETRYQKQEMSTNCFAVLPGCQPFQLQEWLLILSKWHRVWKLINISSPAVAFWKLPPAQGWEFSTQENSPEEVHWHWI